MKSTDWIKNHTKIVLKDCKTGDEIILLDTTGERAKTVDGDIVAGIPFVDVLDDSLDSFVFSLKNCSQRKPFSPFSLVTYTVTNEIDGEIIEDKTKLFVQFCSPNCSPNLTKIARKTQKKRLKTVFFGAKMAKNAFFGDPVRFESAYLHQKRRVIKLAFL